MTLRIIWGQGLSKRRQFITLFLIVIFALSLVTVPVLFSANMVAQEAGIKYELPNNHLLKKRVLELLNQTDLNLGEAGKIAGSIMKESKKYDIPISTFLAIMKKESNFNVNAISPVNARGIMQIHPLIWDAYTKKLNLTVTREHAFDPVLNIKVSAALLSDLRTQYLKKGYNEDILWDYILSAYYAGGESLKTGMKKKHLYYVKKVRKYEQEYEQEMNITI
jgi:soluble lytic murein transglycosylase-like protein